MQDYDTSLFIEIIESIKGIQFLGADASEGVHVRFYQGLRGNRVMIDTSFDDITVENGIGYLEQLGLTHLISTLFPPDPTTA
jgi:hypothetical protein